MSSGALLALIAKGHHNTYLPKDVSTHSWEKTPGSLVSTLNGFETYEYTIGDNILSDLIDSVTPFLTLVPRHSPGPGPVQLDSIADIIDRVYLFIPGPSHVAAEQCITMFDGFALNAMFDRDRNSNLRRLDGKIFVKLPLTSCNIPHSKLVLRIKFKIPMDSTSISVRYVFNEIRPLREWDMPYIARGSCIKYFNGTDVGLVRIKLDMERFDAPVTDVFFTIHDINGGVVHIIDNVELRLNGNTLFSGDRYLCCQHTPELLYNQVYKSATNDTYCISFAEDPLHNPAKGTVNFARVETSWLYLRLAENVRRGRYQIKLHWRYHNVIRRTPEGSGTLFHCGSPLLVKPIGSVLRAVHKNSEGDVPLIFEKEDGFDGKHCEFSYAIKRGELDDPAWFNVTTNATGTILQVSRESGTDHLSEIDLIVRDSKLKLISEQESVVVYRVDVRRRPTTCLQLTVDAPVQVPPSKKRTRTEYDL